MIFTVWKHTLALEKGGDKMQNQELTDRELEICEMITKGYNNRQIAERLYLSEGTVKNYITSMYEKTGVQNRAALTAIYVKMYENVMTELDTDNTWHTSGPRLRLEGLSGLPEIIPIKPKGQLFVIGRYDASVGRKQCDFEFEKTTRAISRRHASIERTADSYTITDLNSRAGTFVNGKRIAPEKPFMICDKDRISFGTAGADYVFED